MTNVQTPKPRKREEETTQLIEPFISKNERSAHAKAAELFNTNRTYINEAQAAKWQKRLWQQ